MLHKCCWYSHQAGTTLQKPCRCANGQAKNGQAANLQLPACCSLRCLNCCNITHRLICNALWFARIHKESARMQKILAGDFMQVAVIKSCRHTRSAATKVQQVLPGYHCQVQIHSDAGIATHADFPSPQTSIQSHPAITGYSNTQGLHQTRCG